MLRQTKRRKLCNLKLQAFCFDPTMKGHSEVHSDFLVQFSFAIEMKVNLKLEVDFFWFANSSEHEFITSNKIHSLSIPITILVKFDRNIQRHLTSKLKVSFQKMQHFLTTIQLVHSGSSLTVG